MHAQQRAREKRGNRGILRTQRESGCDGIWDRSSGVMTGWRVAAVRRWLFVKCALPQKIAHRTRRGSFPFIIWFSLSRLVQVPPSPDRRHLLVPLPLTSSSSSSTPFRLYMALDTPAPFYPTPYSDNTGYAQDDMASLVASTSTGFSGPNTQQHQHHYQPQQYQQTPPTLSHNSQAHAHAQAQAHAAAAQQQQQLPQLGQSLAGVGRRHRTVPAKTFKCTGFGDCAMVFSRSEHLARHVRWVLCSIFASFAFPTSSSFLPSFHIRPVLLPRASCAHAILCSYPGSTPANARSRATAPSSSRASTTCASTRRPCTRTAPSSTRA